MRYRKKSGPRASYGLTPGQYRGAGLLQSVTIEIKVGRRFWQFNPSAENAHAFYVRVVEPLRRFQRRGVVERLQEITATDDRTPIAVEIIGQVDRTKLSKQ
jgi:hypothetical protein